MAQKKVFETDGLAGFLAGNVGTGGSVADTDQVTPKTRGEKRSRVGKDYIDDQSVLQTDIAGTAEDKVTRTTPEAGVYTAATSASLTTVLAGANNDLVFTAKTPGTAGNSITIAYVDPGGVTATLGVVVAGSAITVNLGRAASAINTTATALKAAIDADPTASTMVSVANSGADNGSGLVTAMSQTPLTGGTIGTRVV
jgi:hypothetical protein